MINTAEQKQVQVMSLGQNIKKLSFESKMNRYQLAKLKGQNPSVNFSIGTKQEKIGDTDHEVVSKIGEKREEIFKAQLEYAGIFRIEGEVVRHYMAILMMDIVYKVHWIMQKKLGELEQPKPLLIEAIRDIR